MVAKISESTTCSRGLCATACPHQYFCSCVCFFWKLFTMSCGSQRLLSSECSWHVDASRIPKSKVHWDTIVLALHFVFRFTASAWTGGSNLFPLFRPCVMQRTLDASIITFFPFSTQNRPAPSRRFPFYFELRKSIKNLHSSCPICYEHTGRFTRQSLRNWMRWEKHRLTGNVGVSTTY